MTEIAWTLPADNYPIDEPVYFCMDHNWYGNRPCPDDRQEDCDE